eukprot:4640755-Prymnesium_polylepis.2
MYSERLYSRKVGDVARHPLQGTPHMRHRPLSVGMCVGMCMGMCVDRRSTQREQRQRSTAGYDAWRPSVSGLREPALAVPGQGPGTPPRDRAT